MSQQKNINNSASTVHDIREARNHAEFLRDQLLAEWERLREDELQMTAPQREAPRHKQGRQAMQKAITAANHAIASIDQALSDIERA